MNKYLSQTLENKILGKKTFFTTKCCFCKKNFTFRNKGKWHLPLL